MNALYLTLFVSLILLASFGLLFGVLFNQRTHEHADRLALLPLTEETALPECTATKREQQ